MWIEYDGKVRYDTTQEWYEVEINGATVFVRGSTLDEDDAFALAAMYHSNFSLEVIFEELEVDYLNDIITCER